LIDTITIENEFATFTHIFTFELTYIKPLFSAVNHTKCLLVTWNVEMCLLGWWSNHTNCAINLTSLVQICQWLWYCGLNGCKVQKD